MKERFKAIVAVHLFLLKREKILLLRRYNTGWEDGKYSVIAGHIEGKETVKQAMRREAKEEAGIDLCVEDLKFVHIMHRNADDWERIDFFFVANNWNGVPKNMEPHKCDDLRWFKIDNLPENMVHYVKIGIEEYLKGNLYSEYGW